MESTVLECICFSREPAWAGGLDPMLSGGPFPPLQFCDSLRPCPVCFTQRTWPRSRLQLGSMSWCCLQVELGSAAWARPLQRSPGGVSLSPRLPSLAPLLPALLSAACLFPALVCASSSSPRFLSSVLGSGTAFGGGRVRGVPR